MRERKKGPPESVGNVCRFCWTRSRPQHSLNRKNWLGMRSIISGINSPCTVMGTQATDERHERNSVCNDWWRGSKVGRPMSELYLFIDCQHPVIQRRNIVPTQSCAKQGASGTPQANGRPVLRRGQPVSLRNLARCCMLFTVIFCR